MSELRSQFASSIRTGVVPLDVNFINQSIGPYTSVKWNFGDGSISTEINPTHQYIIDGNFQVSLTIYDAQSGNNISTSSINAYSEINQSLTAATTQQILYTTKRFEPGQINVIKRTQTGSNFETTSPLSSSTALNLDKESVFDLQVIGSNLLGLDGVVLSIGVDDYNSFTGNMSYSSDQINLALLLTCSGSSTGESWSNIFNYVSYSASPVLFYKINAYYGPTLITDRNVPNLGGAVCFPKAYAFLDAWSGGTNYDITGNQKHIIPKTQLAIDNYGTLEATGLTQAQAGKGTLLSLGYDIGTGQTIAAIAPFNSGTSAADAFYPGSMYIGLPWIMWHKQTTPGLQLYDYADATSRDEYSGLRYRYLRDGTSTNDNIVGKVFYDKKMLVLDDDELVAALTWTSNRNWTLGKPSVTQTDVGDGWTSSAITYWVTYRAKETTGQATDYRFGLGGIPPVHCRYVQKITPVDNANLRLEAPISPWFNNNIATASTGFCADHAIEILIATGDTSSPTANSWRYSGTSEYYSGLSGGIKIDFNWDDMTDYQLDSISGTSDMSLGAEVLSFVYLSGTYESSIYKLAATCVAKNTEFNNTQNSTFNLVSNDSTYITEAALYNENNDLLMIGKLSQPIEKNDQKYVTVKLELDI